MDEIVLIIPILIFLLLLPTAVAPLGVLLLLSSDCEPGEDNVGIVNLGGDIDGGGGGGGDVNGAFVGT